MRSYIYFKVFDNKNRIVLVTEYWQEVLKLCNDKNIIRRSDLKPNDNQRFFEDKRIVTCRYDEDKELYFKVYNLTNELVLVTPDWQNAVSCLHNFIKEYTPDTLNYITETDKTLIQIVQL